MGWWPKSSCRPSKVCLPWVLKRGVWDVPRILPGCPRPLGVFPKACAHFSFPIEVVHESMFGDVLYILFHMFCSLPMFRGFRMQCLLVHQALGFSLSQIFGRENPNTLTYLNLPTKGMSEIDAKIIDAEPTQN